MIETMLPVDADTIAAVSTPPGEGGIGVVRLSGSAALAIARRLFRGRHRSLPDCPLPRTAYYGHALGPDGGALDECLLTWFLAPHSYTGEEVVEISGHGSGLALARILESACRLGARVAEPGEFTRRAFLNGRLDLASAEA